MHCPKCNCENNDSAKFCKKCGTPLKKTVTNINTVNNESSKSDTTKYIIIALVIIVIALAGAFAYIGFTSHNNDPIRDNANIEGKQKAGLAIQDVEKAVAALETKGLFYSIHLNSANDIPLKKEDEIKYLDLDAKRRWLGAKK